MKSVRRDRIVRHFPSVREVEAYLLHTGWHKLENKSPNRNRNVVMFSGPNDDEGEPILIALPAHDDLLEVRPRLNEIVRTMSIVQTKTKAQVIREISRLGRGTDLAHSAHSLSVKPRKVSFTEVGK